MAAQGIRFVEVRGQARDKGSLSSIRCTLIIASGNFGRSVTAVWTHYFFDFTVWLRFLTCSPEMLPFFGRVPPAGRLTVEFLHCIDSLRPQQELPERPSAARPTLRRTCRRRPPPW
jgi:hypothetical protein